MEDPTGWARRGRAAGARLGNKRGRRRDEVGVRRSKLKLPAQCVNKRGTAHPVPAPEPTCRHALERRHPGRLLGPNRCLLRLLRLQVRQVQVLLLRVLCLLCLLLHGHVLGLGRLRQERGCHAGVAAGCCPAGCQHLRLCVLQQHGLPSGLPPGGVRGRRAHACGGRGAACGPHRRGMPRLRVWRRAESLRHACRTAGAQRGQLQAALRAAWQAAAGGRR